MSNQLLNFEGLNNVLEGKSISHDELISLYEHSKNNPKELFATSRILRNRFKKNITFSKKAFFNIVNLCRDTCSYCTYKAEPNDGKLSLMSISNIQHMLDMAKRYRCVEALFVTGEEPETKYAEARQWLKSNGFGSTVEYLIHASELALDYGLFPHTNAGNLKKRDMRELQKTNVSLGLMLENVSERLCEKSMPHHLASSKRPKARLRVLESAGELQLPMTTGLLVGIGETPHEMIDSIITLRKLYHTYGNIQEIILQNFQPKQDTQMNGFLPANENYFKIVVALTRIAMPDMNIQVPPNLSPNSYQNFLSIGINDWGGISPLTPDYVNPEFPWPVITKIRNHSKKKGFKLQCRFPAYPEFFPLVNKKLRDKMATIEDNGFVKDDYWI